MKSIQDIIDNQGDEAYRSERDRLKKALMELVTAYRASSTPAETLDKLSDINDAETVIATLVNLSVHDGRISSENKKWASKVGYNDADALRMGLIGDEIHRAHLDQLASAIQLRIHAAKNSDRRINFDNYEKAPAELKRAVIIAHRIMMERMEKESENNSNTSGTP